MICQKCGENLPDYARECFTCGAKVRREVMVEPVVEVAPEPEIAVVKPPRPSGEVLALVLGILPVYAAYQLTGSLIKSCELGRMRLEGIKVLRVYVIIGSVLFIALTAIMLLAFIIMKGAPMALIFVLLMLCYAVLMLRIHNFLYLLQDKSKY